MKTFVACIFACVLMCTAAQAQCTCNQTVVVQGAPAYYQSAQPVYYQQYQPVYYQPVYYQQPVYYSYPVYYPRAFYAPGW